MLGSVVVAWASSVLELVLFDVLTPLPVSALAPVTAQTAINQTIANIPVKQAALAFNRCFTTPPAKRQRCTRPNVQSPRFDGRPSALCLSKLYAFAFNQCRSTALAHSVPAQSAI